MLDSKLNATVKHLDGSESTIFYEYKGEEGLDETLALQWLVEQDLVFVNFFPFAYKKNDPATMFSMQVFVNVNDAFMWGCSDAECIENEDDLIRLMHYVIQDPRWGAYKWAAVKRNEQLQGPIVRDLKNTVHWNAAMDCLPENKIDKAEKIRTKTIKSLSELGLTDEQIHDQTNYSMYIIDWVVRGWDKYVQERENKKSGG